MFDRREFLVLATGAAALAMAGPALAQAKAPQGKDGVSPVELMAEPATKDLWVGKPDAPVTIVEYASLTCSHCAHFHETTWPTLKSKYIDAGKVRFVLREFPLDPVEMACGQACGRAARSS
jgi:protein-disulfide isomerase